MGNLNSLCEQECCNDLNQKLENNCCYEIILRNTLFFYDKIYGTKILDTPKIMYAKEPDLEIGSNHTLIGKRINDNYFTNQLKV